MCISSLMIDTDIIKCLLEDLLDRICLINSPSPIIIKPSSYYSAKSIEDKFNQSINILNNSIKQLLAYELTTVVNNGHLSTTSNIRHGRYYNPSTTIKQMNDFKRRLHWVQQRQMILRQLNAGQEKRSNESNSDMNSIEHIWFEHRLKMLDKSLELLKKQEEEDEDMEKETIDGNEDIGDDSSCARCRIYNRRNETNSQLMQNLKHLHQVQSEHNYFKTHVQYSTSDSNLIASLSKIADHIGHHNISTKTPTSSSSKKSSSVTAATTTTTTTTTIKKKQPPKLHSSTSLIVGNVNKNTKRTIEESRNVSNSNFLSTNYELTNKRHKRIASPQSTPATPSVGVGTNLNSSSSHEILTPSWRSLTNNDFDIPVNAEKVSDQQENEDITDESYMHRHVRCELEQEPWVTNVSTSQNVSLTTARKSGTLQTSLSVPNGLSTTTSQKQYKYRLTPNGIRDTEPMDTK